MNNNKNTKNYFFQFLKDQKVSLSFFAIYSLVIPVLTGFGYNPIMSLFIFSLFTMMLFSIEQSRIKRKERIRLAHHEHLKGIQDELKKLDENLKELSHKIELLMFDFKLLHLGIENLSLRIRNTELAFLCSELKLQQHDRYDTTGHIIDDVEFRIIPEETPKFLEKK